MEGDNVPPDKVDEDHAAKRMRQNTPSKNDNNRTTTTTLNSADYVHLIESITYLKKRLDILEKTIVDNGIELPGDEEPMDIQEETFASMVKSTQPGAVVIRQPTIDLSEVRWNKNNNNTQRISQLNANTRNRSALIPPIVVEDNENRKQIWEAVKKITDKVTFSPINSKRYRICVTDNLENYQKVLELVKSAGLKGNTYTPKEFKPISLLVRNLEYVDVDETKIKEEFAKIGVVVLKAVQWSTKMMASKNKFFWLVQFHPKTDLAKLKEKRLMMNVAVRYEPPTNKLKIMQCGNCKHFEHAKSSCFNEFRCIKCPEKHEPGACELPESSKPYCCNCMKYDHAANSPNCPVYVRLLNRRKIGNDAQTQQQKNVKRDNDGFTVVGKNGRAATIPFLSAEEAKNWQVSPSLRYKRFDPNETNVSLMAAANNPHIKRTYPQQKQQQIPNSTKQQQQIEALDNKVESILAMLDSLFGRRNGY